MEVLEAIKHAENAPLYEFEELETDDELMHFGIKGMKWGIRRYQRKDGSLTKKGLKRYSKDEAKLKKEKKTLRNKIRTKKKIEKLNNLKKETEEMKKTAKEKETPEAKRERLLKSNHAKDLYENKDLLTTAKLNERINRIDTEARLKQKIPEEPKKYDKILDVINKATTMYKTVDSAYSTVKGSSIGKDLAKKLGLEEDKSMTLEKARKVLKNINNAPSGEVDKAQKLVDNADKLRYNIDKYDNPDKYKDNGGKKGKGGLSESKVRDIVNEILEEREDE